MGKSSKKTKSDRINELRKQYDSFMEENKKRKDRNDFILGSLENMRLSNAMVPIHHTANPHLKKDSALQNQKLNYFQKRTLFENSPLLLTKQKTDVLLDNLKEDEEAILKEISKKYILIPKLRSTRENMAIYYNAPDINDDTEWKSKYNILDELKKIEKEEPPQTKTDICDNFSSKHGNLKSINKKNINESNLRSQKIDEEVLPSAMQINKIVNKTTPESKSINKIHTKLSKESLIPCKNDINAPLSTIPHDISDLKVMSSNINEEFHDRGMTLNVVGGNESKNDINLNHQYFEDKHQNDNEKTIPSVKVEKNILLINGNIKTEKVSPNDTELSNSKLSITNFTDRSNDVANKEETKNEIVSRPDEINQSYDDTPSENVGQCEPFLENLKQQEYEQNFENNDGTVISENVITSQIDDFETEQKEMFYSEESEYHKNHTDALEYNKQSEQYASEQYANEHYSYYDESQQDQSYYAEINEHEESTERYDPNYEQQYVNNYEDNANVGIYGTYENQQEVTNVNYNEHSGNLEFENSGNIDNTDQIKVENESENIANENVNYDVQQCDNEMAETENYTTAPDEQNVYQIQPDYTEMQSEHDTVENLENQLDREEGYVAIENPVSNETASELENLPEVPSEIQQSDITLVP